MKIKRDINPNSLANLTRDGRPPIYDSPKKVRSLRLTDEVVDAVKASPEYKEAKNSLSETIERVLRRQFM